MTVSFINIWLISAVKCDNKYRPLLIVVFPTQQLLPWLVRTSGVFELC